MAAYLDFSSYATPLTTTTHTTTHNPASSAFEHAFGIGPLRPVDDALLDSPLDLELSPALSTYDSMSSSSGASSCFSSPFLVDFDAPGPGLGGSISPALVDDHHATSSSSASYPSLFAPVPAATMTTEIDMVALATSLGVTLPPLMAATTTAPAPAPASVPTIPTLSFIREEDEEEEEEDVKPNVGDLLVSPGTGPMAASTSSNEDVVVVVPAAAAAPTALAPESTPPPSSSSSSSSSCPPTGAEAAAATAKRDKFTGIRNTKKPPVAYDAPTLPKNYYTESATSKKKRALSSSSSSGSNKRARSEVSVTPEHQPVPVPVAARLPSAQPEPMPEDEFDDSQLSAIELKRRQNTLAARRSRARKSAYIQELKDEIDQLKQVNEQLLAQLAAGGGGGGANKCASCGGGGGGP